MISFLKLCLAQLYKELVLGARYELKMGSNQLGLATEKFSALRIS
jgi:hypothetical protein